MNRNTSFGVYFSANDKVFAWVLAFLQSFRDNNPTIELRLIPFDDNCERILKFRERFRFSLHIDACFRELETIGDTFELGHTPHGRYWFRRYAAFWGSFDRFAYFDARQLVLSDLKPFLDLLDQCNLDLIHFDAAINQVYESGKFRSDLVTRGLGAGFNSGRWLARKGSLTLQDFQKLGRQALQVRDQLNPRNTDQAFINYVCDMKPVRYAHIADLDGELARDGWARQPGGIYRDAEGNYRIWDHGGLQHRKRLVLLHWAGIGLSTAMPHAELFFRCHDRDCKLRVRVLRRLVRAIQRPGLRLLGWLRGNRMINQAFHRLRSR